MPKYPISQTHVEDSKGTITADGTEQTVREITWYTRGLEAYIDLTNMTTGDATVIRSYAKIKSGGSYIRLGSRTLVEAQDPPLMYVRSFPVSRYGFKITLQQISGTNRDYDWMTFLEI